MIAEIVSVGTELLMGQVLNTDAQFIAQHLAPLGYRALYQVTVGDNRQRLEEAVHTSLARSDVVLFTGGLGPTEDDLTKETVAAALGKEMVLYEEEEKKLRAWFEGRGRTMTPNNLKQACFPPDAILLPNPRGTAPGCIMEAEGKAAVLLPGPPNELFPMFRDYVLPYLEKRSGVKLYSKSLRFFGIGESDLTYRLRDLISAQSNPTMATYCKIGECELRVTALCGDVSEGEALMAPVLEEIRSRTGSALYSEQGESLAECCVRLLKERGATLAVSESCTGGMVASSIVDVAGCSEVFIEGAVTYANDAKMRRLGVREETLRTVGAVSEACAREMAEGLRRESGADFALSTTGIAGPDGGTPEKPVGLVYVAVACERGTFVKELRLKGDRQRIRTVAALQVLDLLRKVMPGIEEEPAK